jgi:predicted Ser/Thr protein kinase/tetratricopeptide (TPR) repeat protein
MNLPEAIDRYRIRERLGQGGMGALFLALDPAIDRLVAIKVLRVDNPDVRERFQREARLAARLQHPNIVTVYDVGEHDGQPFIAMEYIPGETLGELIRRRAPLDVRQRIELVIEICSGLAFAHKNGIVHRDIKPANLILSRDSNILKILDFGIARAGESGLTQVGMVIGTPNYMSPEQVRGEAIDQRSDIFAVGLVLYELLVYRQAFEAETQPAVLMKILSDQPAPLASLDPTIDPNIATIVYKALAKNPADRYQDLGAMKADLVRIVQRLETESPDDRTMVVPPPPPRGMQVVPSTPPGTTMSTADRVARHFAAIEAAIAAGDDAKARQELQLATQAAPGHPKLGEMGARITQARNARELARSIAEGRARLAAGAITEAGQWLVRAQKVDPRAPEVAELRQEIERVADGREQDQDRRRRVAAALAHAREALKAGAFDTSMRAVIEALGIHPDDAEALALKAEIEAARAAAPAGSGQTPPRTAGGRAVGPPPPASARDLSAGPPPVRPATGPRAATPPPTPPPIAPGHTPAPAGAAVPERRSSKRPIAFLGLAAVAAVLFGLGAIFVWRQVSARFFAPRTAQQAPATPGTMPAPPADPGSRTPPAAVEPPATPPGEPQANATPGHAEPPAAPPTTPSGEDAAITTRLAQALADFQGQRTTEALTTLAALIDEAPQRDDLRVTADQWARAIQARAVELRDSARKRPGQLPPVMRQANQHLRQGETELAAGDPIAAARAFERGREAWAVIVNRQAARGPTDGGDDSPTPPAPSSPPPREPAPAEPPRTAAREPAPREPEPSSRPAPPSAALTPEEEFERAQIMRLLQSFKRAFDSRSGDSLRPIWPSLTAGAAQSYQSQWQQSLTQQWTYNSVNIRMGGDGKRATVDCEVTVTSLSQGDRENSATRRRVRFDLQRLGPLWVIDGVGGI